MTATSPPPAGLPATPGHPAGGVLDRADGVELLGPVQGSGYRDGAALVRRSDGQMVRLGPLMYGLLECIDGRRDLEGLAAAMTERLGRRLDGEQVARLAQKLAAQGLLAGTEQAAPPRSHPLLALRWKVLVTDPAVTRRITGPFTVLFRPWVMWPVLMAFLAVCWFVLVDKGVASATSEAFHSPGLLLLVFALAVLSAGAHELGHAAACRYSGAEPGGMGMGLYLVWPAFYTDVTDAYRLPRRDRLRVDLAGLYFNAVIAVLTTAVWLVVRRDALLLLVALQLLQMVKQLSPIIRADGYHILADATGVPDLYAHLGPTMRRLVPGRRREPSALTGRARVVVTVWVLVVVPILLSLMVGAVLLVPRLVGTAWESGQRLAGGLPAQFGAGDVLGVLASLLQLVALVLPVVGSLLVSRQLVRKAVATARTWTAGRPRRRIGVLLGATAVAAALLWTWWPAGQYQPVRPSDEGTVPALARLVAGPRAAVRPAASASAAPAASGNAVAAGTYVALTAVPQGGATPDHPALFVLPGRDGAPPTAVVTADTGSPAGDDGAAPGSGTATLPASAFPFRLPAAPGPGGTQALAVGSRDGGVVYDISYAVVTITDGAPVTNSNSAFALAHCAGCTTVAVSFQVVLVVGESDVVAPINAAGALNVDCPACVTAAIADQIVVTVSGQPSEDLQRRLEAALSTLDTLPRLGAGGSPAAIAALVSTVQQQVETILDDSKLLTAGTVGSTASASATSAPAGTGITGSGATSTGAATGSRTAGSPAGATPTTEPSAGASAGSGSIGTDTTAASSSAAPSTDSTSPEGAPPSAASSESAAPATATPTP